MQNHHLKCGFHPCKCQIIILNTKYQPSNGDAAGELQNKINTGNVSQTLLPGNCEFVAGVPVVGADPGLSVH